MNLDAFLIKTEKQALHDYIAMLSERDQVVLNLFYFGDFSAAEIGIFIGKKRDATLKRLERAKERLRQRMLERET